MTEPRHMYMSTACRHANEQELGGLHDLCRLVCKYCKAPCECYCHTEETE